MSFEVIFLCLLIGTVIGYEVGKYTTSRKIGALLNNFAEQLKKTGEGLKKEAEARKERAEAIQKIIMETKAKEIKDDGKV